MPTILTFMTALVVFITTLVAASPLEFSKRTLNDKHAIEPRVSVLGESLLSSDCLGKLSKC